MGELRKIGDEVFRDLANDNGPTSLDGIRPEPSFSSDFPLGKL